MPGFTALIPMDTTEQSEDCFQVLPMLKSIGFGKVKLVGVFDSSQRQPQRQDGKYAGSWSADFIQSYLQAQVAAVQALGLEVETQVVSGKAAESLVKAAGEPDVDLVLVATHGRTGIARIRLGSVADTVIKDSPCPTLVVGPNADIDLESYSLKRILVPLDGSELAELALPIAKHLATTTGAQIDLLRTVSLTAVASDPAASGVDLLTPLLDGAEQYLKAVAAGMPALKVTTSVVMGGPGDGILAHLGANEVDLVIMASHGRTGLARVAMGSVAEQVLHGPDPVLIFEPKEDKGAFMAAARASS